MKIQILIDNKNSWINRYIDTLIKKISYLGYNVNLINHHNEIKEGDVLFILSCEKILKNLNLNKHNIVVHESDLPDGKGFSPLSWQILEGKNEIPITLFEATENIDSGTIYFKDKITFNGSELVEELRIKQFEATVNLIMKFLENIKNLPRIQNSGIGSRYRRRKPIDSMLDINKSILEQFNKLRIVDNNRYPAFFILNNIKYKIEISKI